MQFASLGSGSQGNATVVRAGDTCLLIDCGFSMRELAQRCRNLGIALETIDALLVTHEHSDHIKGVGPVARRYGMPVWMTHGTWRSARCGEIPNLHLFSSHCSQFCLGAFKVQPYAVPHDAAEPCQYVLEANGWRLGLLTDAGRITPHMKQRLHHLDALILECNHDPDLLRNGPYPLSLQARVGGPYGHLSNHQAADFLASIDYRRLQHVLLGHLSEKNNRPELARQCLATVCPNLASRLLPLEQGQCSGWFELLHSHAPVMDSLPSTGKPSIMRRLP